MNVRYVINFVFVIFSFLYVKLMSGHLKRPGSIPSDVTLDIFFVRGIEIRWYFDCNWIRLNLER